MVSTEQAKPFEEKPTVISALYAVDWSFIHVSEGLAQRFPCLSIFLRWKRQVFMYQINRDRVIHSLSFGFSMTKKEDSNKKRKKKA